METDGTLSSNSRERLSVSCLTVERLNEMGRHRSVVAFITQGTTLIH